MTRVARRLWWPIAAVWVWSSGAFAQPAPDAGTGWGDLQPADAGPPPAQVPSTEPGARPEVPVSRGGDDEGETRGGATTASSGGWGAEEPEPQRRRGEGAAAGVETDAGDDEEDDDEEDDEGGSLWPRNLQVAGFVDVYTMLHFQALGADRANLRAFDIRTSEIALSYAELAVWMAPEPLGFRLDLGFGPTAALVSNGDPINEAFESRTVVPTAVQLIQQAYGSAHFDVGGGLTLDVGKFVTPLGQEVIESRDNWVYSRSLLFTYAIPFYHLGLRLNYVFGEAFNATLLVVNGWDNIVDNNDGKTFGLSLGFRPTESLQIFANYMLGPEQSDRRRSDEDGDWRHMLDLVVLFSPSPLLSLGLNVDLGMESSASCELVQTCEEDAEEGDAMWFGGAFTARVNPLDWLSIAARGEWFRDNDGFRTGTEQSIIEGTLTLEARYATNMIVRLEYRHDQSTEAVFSSGETLDPDTGMEPEDALVEGQDTVTLGLTIGF